MTSELMPGSLRPEPPASQKDNLESLADRYVQSPTVRALVQLVPLSIGSALDTFVSVKLNNLRIRRRRAFFDALEHGSVQLSPELVASDEFLHCFMITIAAVDRARREAKIRSFAQLLISATTDGDPRTIDDYEDLLGTVDQLSEAEVRVLLALEEYECRYYENGRFKNEGRASGLLLPIAARHLGVSQQALTDGDLRAIVMRLNRLGLYGLFGWRMGPAHDCSLTPTYARVKRFICDSVT
jgi:hypothetical protein